MILSVGRIFTGWLSDFPSVNATVVTVVAVFVGGVTIIVTPFLPTFELLASACVIFGLCVAAFISLTSIVLVDLVGLDQLTSAFGLLNLFRHAHISI
jgi:MFS family permease